MKKYKSKYKKIVLSISITIKSLITTPHIALFKENTIQSIWEKQINPILNYNKEQSTNLNNNTLETPPLIWTFTPENLIEQNNSPIYNYSIQDRIYKYSTQNESKTNKKRFKCNQCQKEFPQKINLIRHIRTHTKEKPFKCKHCHKKFSQKSNLKTHNRIHTNKKIYTCTYCNKKFSDKSNLIKHIRIHTKNKPFSCNYCQKKFSQKSSLTRHIRIHTKEKPYTCTNCKKKFSDKSNLTRHTKTHTKKI